MKMKREVNIGVVIDKLKIGADMLRLSNGRSSSSSASRLYSIVAGVLGMGIGMGSLLLLSRRKGLEGKDSSEASLYVPGLQNLGNNCFLNVVLQAVASCSGFYDYLQKVFGEDDIDLTAVAAEMPLTCTLTSLLKDLCIIREEKIVLNPRKVMIAMSQYVSAFNLTRQQDAAEAFLHLLSSLEEEFSDIYVTSCSLTDAFSLTGRIYTQHENQKDLRKRREQIHSPFDGTTGSTLTCITCASQLSMDFDVFRCLPLSPVLDGHGEIMGGCTVADCLKQFTAAECLQNYKCSRCWHIAALKHLSLKEEENEARISSVSQCSKLDSCNCKNLFHDAILRLIGYSCAVKQLSIAHCPEVLCLHLQRASMNGYGEFIKLKGYVSFPLILDIFPYTVAAKKLGFRAVGEDCSPPMSRLHQELSSHPGYSALELKMQLTTNRDMLHGKMVASENSNFQEPLLKEMQFDKKANEKCNPSPLKNYKYDLASVIEHYGRPGSGHYAIYRKLTGLNADSYPTQSNIHEQSWLYISDGEVSSVSLESVLAAEASLLIYERIECDK